MFPSRLSAVGVMLALTACSTQAPPPLDATHPAHSGAAVGAPPDADAPAPLSTYRDFSPRARTVPATASPTGSEEHHDHQAR